MFADYTHFWKHNGLWFFNSPQIIREIARENSIELDGTSLFYYEVDEQQYDGEQWQEFAPEPSLLTNAALPQRKQLEGFDVATFYCGTSPECSPLSCNSLAGEIEVNKHCLLKSLEHAKALLEQGVFKNSEPGPYRILAVYLVEWP